MVGDVSRHWLIGMSLNVVWYFYNFERTVSFSFSGKTQSFNFILRATNRTIKAEKVELGAKNGNNIALSEPRCDYWSRYTFSEDAVHLSSEYPRAT